jgi:hypothetical protein
MAARAFTPRYLRLWLSLVMNLEMLLAASSIREASG